MQTLTSRSTSRAGAGRDSSAPAPPRSWPRRRGSAAGAATTPPPTRARRQRQRRRPHGVEHGGAEPQHRPDHGQLDVDDAVLEDGDRVGQLAGRRRLRHRHRHALEDVEDDDRGAHASRCSTRLVDGVVHAASVGRTGGRRRRRRAGGFGRGRWRLRGRLRRAAAAARGPASRGGAARRVPPALGRIAIASGKVTGVSGSTVSVSGIDIVPGSFTRRPSPPSSKSSKTKKPADAQDREPQGHDIGLHDGERDPDGGRHGPGRG